MYSCIVPPSLVPILLLPYMFPLLCFLHSVPILWFCFICFIILVCPLLCMSSYLLSTSRVSLLCALMPSCVHAYHACIHMCACVLTTQIHKGDIHFQEENVVCRSGYTKCYESLAKCTQCLPQCLHRWYNRLYTSGLTHK